MNGTPIDLKLEDIVSANEKMTRCLKLAALAASSEVPVLILGETGTGKTLLARAIHNSSARARRPFVSFNASALSDTLLESDLFGHERGSFTGALKMVKGKFEQADSGTLFFDEIADMSPLAQVKILRAVEYGEFERLGAERMLRSDVRVISASNRPLRELVRDGKFREDLYHRLNGVTLVIPPLRERREELRGLIAIELKAAATAAKKKITSIHPSAMEALLNHGWAGNLRELNHVMRTVVLFCGGKIVLPEHVVLDLELGAAVLPPAASSSLKSPVPSTVSTLGENDASLSAAIHRHIHSVYEACGHNQRLAARMLGISRGRLARQLSKTALK